MMHTAAGRVTGMDWQLGLHLVAGTVAVLTGCAALARRALRWMVEHAEDVGGAPQRLRAGWHLARARADDAAVLAAVARRRRQQVETRLAAASGRQPGSVEVRTIIDEQGAGDSSWNRLADGAT